MKSRRVPDDPAHANDEPKRYQPLPKAAGLLFHTVSSPFRQKRSSRSGLRCASPFPAQSHQTQRRIRVVGQKCWFDLTWKCSIRSSIRPSQRSRSSISLLPHEATRLCQPRRFVEGAGPSCCCYCIAPRSVRKLMWLSRSALASGVVANSSQPAFTASRNLPSSSGDHS